MGEVYRAEDLTLGQVVALKFLPPALVRDPEWLTRFRGEVRAARQVSHPNVCRVYDIGEADGQTFLSMEFVGGEDLATLLRRIGRIGSDKGGRDRPRPPRGPCGGGTTRASSIAT
jgi:serine/threonine protein kinase